MGSERVADKIERRFTNCGMFYWKKGMLNTGLTYRGEEPATSTSYKNYESEEIDESIKFVLTERAIKEYEVAMERAMEARKPRRWSCKSKQKPSWENERQLIRVKAECIHLFLLSIDMLQLNLRLRTRRELLKRLPFHIQTAFNDKFPPLSISKTTLNQQNEFGAPPYSVGENKSSFSRFQCYLFLPFFYE